MKLIIAQFCSIRATFIFFNVLVINLTKFIMKFLCFMFSEFLTKSFAYKQLFKNNAKVSIFHEKISLTCREKRPCKSLEQIAKNGIQLVAVGREACGQRCYARGLHQQGVPDPQGNRESKHVMIGIPGKLGSEAMNY